VSKQPKDSLTLYPPGDSLVHTEVTLRPEYGSTPTAPLLQVISKLPSFRRLQLHARQPQQQISLDLRKQLYNQIFFHIHNVSCLPDWIVMNKSEFLCMQSQQSSASNHDRTTNQHAQVMRLRGSRPYHLLPDTETSQT